MEDNKIPSFLEDLSNYLCGIRNLSMNYIDVESIDEKAAEEAFKDIEEGQSNSDKLKKECLEKYVDNLVKGLEEAKPSTEKNEAIDRKSV